MAEQPAQWRIWLTLGRVSNLPTVWSNVLAAWTVAMVTLQCQSAGLPLFAGCLRDAALQGMARDLASLAGLLAIMLAMTFFYVGGMFLNDAYDAELDALERPDRPIPAGHVSRTTVLRGGYLMLLAGIILTVLVGWQYRGEASFGSVVSTGVSALALAAAIVVYDLHHKQNRFSPMIMGLCRVLVYITTAVAVGAGVTALLLIACVVLWLYLVGLTAIAKQENLRQIHSQWPLLLLGSPLLLWLVLWGLGMAASNAVGWVVAVLLLLWVARAYWLLAGNRAGAIPQAVAGMIAGISLVDALLVAALAGGGSILLLLCLGCFALTLFSQRYIAGT